MRIEVPVADVVDRLSILAIKEARLASVEARANVRDEIAALQAAWTAQGLPRVAELPQWARLATVNEALWEVEDALRACESRSDFGDDFVSLARSVYRLNDERAALKRSINLDLKSKLIEEKSYHPTSLDQS